MKSNSYFGRLVLAPILLFSLFVTSCGPKIEYREDTIRPVTYEIITEKGLKRWGLVNYMDGRVIDRYLEPVYDSIYHSQDIKYLFFALKNGNVYAYKENGKWGVKLKKVMKGIGSNSSETKYIPFLPAKYDAAIEVACPNDYWLVKENGIWKAFKNGYLDKVTEKRDVIGKLITSSSPASGQ